MGFLPSTLTILGTNLHVLADPRVDGMTNRALILYKNGVELVVAGPAVDFVQTLNYEFGAEADIATILWKIRVMAQYGVAADPIIWEYSFYLDFDPDWGDWGPISYDPNQYIFASTEAGTYICTLRLTIAQQIPTLLDPESISSSLVKQLTMKWQELLYEGVGVSLENRYSEYRWPHLANTLIAYLIIRDSVYNSLSASALAAAATSSSSSEGGAIKKIETGPVNVERHDGSSVASKAFTAMFNRPGLWEDIQAQLCSLAAKLGIHISGCKNPVVIPLKVIRGSDYAYENQYPRTPLSKTKPSE